MLLKVHLHLCVKVLLCISLVCPDTCTTTLCHTVTVLCRRRGIDIKKGHTVMTLDFVFISFLFIFIFFADLIYVHRNNLDVHDVLCVTNPQLRWFNECQAFRQPLFTVLPLTPQDCVLRRFRLRLRRCPIKTPGPHRPIGTCRIESRRSSTATRSLETSLCSTCRRPRR